MNINSILPLCKSKVILETMQKYNDKHKPRKEITLTLTVVPTCPETDSQLSEGNFEVLRELIQEYIAGWEIGEWTIKDIRSANEDLTAYEVGQLMGGN